MLEKLQELLQNDEAIYEIPCCASMQIYILGPDMEAPQDIDISSCIEETLHRMLDAGCSDEEIFSVLGAVKESASVNDNDFSIDLGYIIPDFYPMAVIHTGIVFAEPSGIYSVRYWDTVLCKHFVIPDDINDDDLLVLMHEKFGINDEEYIVNDIRDDGSMIGVQNVLDDALLFVLKRKASCRVPVSEKAA